MDLTNNGDISDDYNHAAHRRAQELSTRKAFERITSSKVSKPSQLDIDRQLGPESTDDENLASSPSRSLLRGVGEFPTPISPPGKDSVKSSPPSPSPRPRGQTQTEDEIFEEGLADYLYNRHSSDGTFADPRDVLFEAIPEPFYESEEFQRVSITETAEPPDEDASDACLQLRECILLRNKYISAHPIPPQDLREPFNSSTKREDPIPIDSALRKERHPNDYRRRTVPIYDIFEEPAPCKWEWAESYQFVMQKGVIALKHIPNTRPSPAPPVLDVIQFDEFLRDFATLRKAVHNGPVTSYAFTRLELLSAKYNIHILLNETRELVAQKSVPHRDFYNIRKVDTHVHHSACMSQKHLLRFIKHKLRFDPHEVVIERDGKLLTLGEVFMSLRLTAYDLSIDTLDMHAHNTFNRFDRFNLKYNPAGQSRLREIFLKTDNFMKGKYLAEVTKEVMGDLTASKYQLVEWRVSIYGRKESEWDKLSLWFYDNRLAHPNVRWLIQIPRLFANYRASNEVATFQDFLTNIFRPLFLVSADPTSNLPLHYFLETIVGIDSVDDESKPEHGHLNSGPTSVSTPDCWTVAENPPFGYWMYYMYANITALNRFRAARGLCTLEFRPHCGEAGDLDHLVSTYLLAHKINHGILLRKNAALQYLYYLSQIGIAMSPLSNNKLFLDYHKNPFPRYFQQGLNVSLSTDDPLMLHYTKDPLLEEFSVAAQVWKLSSADQCEIARNSVLQSGWEARYKLHFLGQEYSDIRETNVPKIRLMFRQETLKAELDAIFRDDL